MTEGSPGSRVQPAPTRDERDEPLVVFGPVSERYDFGSHHPLTPRRFGPGIDLMRRTGATRFGELRPASDEQLFRLHERAYVDAVRAFSADPDRPPQAGIGPGDTPAFHGMHDVSAAIAGGSIAGVQTILAGQATHGFQPGGGLHHAMAGRAGGFCIYNDIAFAVAAARDAGHRVLYVDLDVHHGDGVQDLFWDDPQVLTLSIHETGESLFPGTGAPWEVGGPHARGTAVNVPLEAFSGDASWWPAVESIVPALADAFRPTFLVSQHGCDSHAFDPLAHLMVTTAAYARAAALLDEMAHEHCEGRWFAGGGGGYDAYRVVPRSWSLVWLAQAHRDVPDAVPDAWRERWAREASEHDQAPPPRSYLDPAGLVRPDPPELMERNRTTVLRSLDQALQLLVTG